MEQEFNIGAMKAQAIAKSFGVDLEKGRVGVYEDNAENRRLNRVGQPYGHKKEEEAPKGRQAAQPQQSQSKQGAAAATSMAEHAAAASDGALKRAAADPNAAPDVKAAAEKELANRGDGKKEITIQSLQDCDTNVQQSEWGEVHSISPQPIRVSGGNFGKSDNEERKEFLHLSLYGDKKTALKNIESINSKLGLNLNISQFERVPGNRYDPSCYEIYYNPDTGTWGSDKEIWEELRQYYHKGDAEKAKKQEKEKKKLLSSAIKSDLSFDSVSKILEDDDETREAVHTYFNYDPEFAEENGATQEQLEFCKKLEKLGATLAPKTFDYSEEEEAKEYEEKMRSKGYAMFDVYKGDSYVWLVVKEDKLKK